MIEHVCVAYDGRSASREALALAGDLARPAGARVTVARVVPPLDEVATAHDGVLGDMVGPLASLRRETEADARRLASGVDSRVALLTGVAADQIVALTERERPDLLVAGARRSWWGGVASERRRLLASAPCPLLLVPQGAGRIPLRTIATRSGQALEDLGSVRARGGSLLWQLLAANALVLLVAVLVLVFAPVGVSRNAVVATEVAVLGVGLAAILAVNALLLRRTLAPLRTLSDAMAIADPARPGLRLQIPDERAAEVRSLAIAFNDMLERLESERRESSRRALIAQEDERLRIAREMHDQIGQTLTALTIQAERAAGQEELDRELLDRVATTALEALEDVRRIGRELRPEALDDLGLGNALIAMCRRLEQQSGVRIAASLGSVPPLRSELELVFYRVAQEAVTNALRHSGAARIDVRLSSSAGVRLSVRDDGTGMPEGFDGESAGIAGMRERALLAGGELLFLPGSDSGTEVRLTVPLERALA